MQLLSAYTGVTKEEMNAVQVKHICGYPADTVTERWNGIARGYSESNNDSMKPELQKWIQ